MSKSGDTRSKQQEMYFLNRWSIRIICHHPGLPVTDLYLPSICLSVLVISVSPTCLNSIICVAFSSSDVFVAVFLGDKDPEFHHWK